jgi:PST family polysaccharide transporter
MSTLSSDPTRYEPPTPDSHTLDRMLVSGIAWTAVGRWAAQAISWIATIYVARILGPADYGIVAMATIPIGLARMIEGLGLDAILLQDRSLTKDQLRRLSGAALLLGTGLTLLYVGLSVPISLYFHEPQLASIVSFLSLTFIFDAAQVLPRALLQRDLRFRTLAWVNGLQVTIAAGTMALAARSGWAYWALVANSLVSYVLITIVLYFYKPIIPAWPRELRQLTRSLISGWHILMSRIAYYGYSSADSTIIGRYLGKEALGVFGFATTFSALPVKEVTSLMIGVVPGIFTAVQTDRPAMRRYFLLLTEVISYLTLPASMGLALTADDFVLLTLGENWKDVVTPLRLLCVYMAMYSAQELFSHVLLWTGHFAVNMWLTVFALAVLLPCFFVGVHFGLVGVAVGWLIGFPLSLVPVFFYVNRILGISWVDYWRAFQPALTACGVMLICVIFTRYLLPDTWHHGVRLAIQASLGVSVYSAAMIWMFGGRVRDLYHIIRKSTRRTDDTITATEDRPAALYQHP